MADALGRPDSDEEEDLLLSEDYLGQEAPVAFQGQPALPITGGPAVGSPTGPATVGGFAPPGPKPPSTATGTPTRPVEGGDDGSLLGDVGQYISPGLKLLDVANKIYRNATAGPAPFAAGATETPSGQLTVSSPEILRELQYPDVVSGPPAPVEPPPAPAPDVSMPSDVPTGPLPSDAPPATTTAPDVPTGGTPSYVYTPPSGEPIPDDVVAMFGGDRAAVEQAYGDMVAAYPPETVQAMANSGQLTTMGVEAGTYLTPTQIQGLQSGLAVAGLVVMGLSMAGVLTGEAPIVLGSLISLVSGGFAIAAMGGAITALSSGAATGLAAVGAVGTIASGVGAILAPFIAWGMAEIQEAMEPNIKADVRRGRLQTYEGLTSEVNRFNHMIDAARTLKIKDPNVLNQLLTFGQELAQAFYAQQQWGEGASTRGGGPVSAYDYVHRMPWDTRDQILAPWRSLWQNISALDQQLGSTAYGSEEWYRIFARGDPLQAGQPGMAGEYQYGLPMTERVMEQMSGDPQNLPYWYGDVPAEYTNRGEFDQYIPGKTAWTEGELRAIAGADPMDWVINQWARLTPGWNPQTW